MSTEFMARVSSAIARLSNEGDQTTVVLTAAEASALAVWVAGIGLAVGTPGRYAVSVFDIASARLSAHHCDGTYDAWSDALLALREARNDPNVGKVLISWN